MSGHLQSVERRTLNGKIAFLLILLLFLCKEMQGKLQMPLFVKNLKQ